MNSSISSTHFYVMLKIIFYRLLCHDWLFMFLGFHMTDYYEFEISNRCSYFCLYLRANNNRHQSSHLYCRFYKEMEYRRLILWYYIYVFFRDLKFDSWMPLIECFIFCSHGKCVLIFLAEVYKKFSALIVLFFFLSFLNV